MPALEFAILIVCRNALDPLRVTIASVLELADSRVRLYVVDGASSDGTPDYLRTVATQVAGWVSESDIGIYDAMNKAWRMAPDDALVLFLGAGDRLLELPTAAELLDSEGKPWPIVLGRCMIGTWAFHSHWGGAEMYLRNTAHHQALMIRKDIWPNSPFDNGLRVYGDWDFNLRLVKLGWRARSVDSLRTYAEPGGASWHHDLAEIFRVARRHGGLLVGVLAYALNGWTAWRLARRRLKRERRNRRRGNRTDG